MEPFLPFLQAYVEGKKTQSAWREWWQSNSDALQTIVSRLQYLRFKYQPMRQARATLEEFNMAYQTDKTRCQDCGENLFIALPGHTTQQEIRDFARSHKLLGATNIANEGWIHPGRYCRNGCVAEMWNIKRD